MGDQAGKLRISGRSELKRVGIAAAILVVIYAVAVLLLPNLKIFAVSSSLEGKEEKTETIEAGKTYETEFEMPYSRLCSFSVPLEQEENAEFIVAIDAVMRMTDASGKVLAEKTILSAYENVCNFSYISVQKGGVYKISLEVRSAGQDPSCAPVLKTDENGTMLFTVRGLVGSSDNKAVFTLMYMVVAAMVLVFVYTMNKPKIGDAHDADTLITGILMLIALYAICQFSDLYDISRSALSMVRAFEHGQLKYMDAGYLEGLADQTAAQRFICDYNFTIIAVVALILMPIYPFYYTSLPEHWQGYAPVLILSIVILILVRVAASLFKKITKECGMDKRYLENVQMIFLSSSLLLFISLGFGQIDIMYIVVILLALPFYYKKNYLAFSAIMSVAVAMKTLPILIFAPLLLLAVKKLKDIFINTGIVLVIPVLSKLIFGGGQGYEFITRCNDVQYGYTGRIIETTLGENVSVFALAFVVICVLAYLHKPDTENKKEMLHKSMLVMFITYTVFLAFVPYHAQWMIPLVLSFSFLLPFYKENRTLLLLSLVAELLFILECGFSCVSIKQLLNGGMIVPLVGQSYEGNGLVQIFGNISPMCASVIKSAMIAVVLCMAGYLYKNRKEVDGKTQECSRQWVVGRTGVLYGFILFCSWCFSFIG